jgi:hypothetical protein
VYGLDRSAFNPVDRSGLIRQFERPAFNLAEIRRTVRP